jgi:hypothetical protein
VANSTCYTAELTVTGQASPADSQLKSKTSTICHIHICILPPDDGLLIHLKHVQVWLLNKQKINSTLSRLSSINLLNVCKHPDQKHKYLESVHFYCCVWQLCNFLFNRLQYDKNAVKINDRKNVHEDINLSFYFKVGYFHTRYWCSIDKIFLYHQSTQIILCCMLYVLHYTFLLDDLITTVILR